MRIKYGILYGLLAAVGVAAGLKLPDMVFDSMDRKSTDQPVLYKTSAVQFEQEADMTLSDYLRLAGGQISWQDIAPDINPEIARSTPESVYKAAMEALRLFVSYEQSAGVPEAFIQQQKMILKMMDEQENAHNGFENLNDYHEEMPLVAIANMTGGGSNDPESGVSADDRGEDKRMAAIFWRCMLQDKNGNLIVMIVDDVTGKVLSIEGYFFGSGEPMDADEIYEVSRLLPNALSGFFADYYALDVSHMRHVRYSEQGAGVKTAIPAMTEAGDLDSTAIADADGGVGVDDGGGNGGATETDSNQRVLESYISGASGDDDGESEASASMDRSGLIMFYLKCIDAGGDELSIPVTLDRMWFSLNKTFLDF